MDAVFDATSTWACLSRNDYDGDGDSSDQRVDEKPSSSSSSSADLMLATASSASAVSSTSVISPSTATSTSTATAGTRKMVWQMEEEVQGATIKQVLCDIANSRRDCDEAACIVLCAVIKEHGVSNSEVSICGFGAIYELAGYKQFRKKIGELGGCELVLSSMRALGESSQAVTCSCFSAIYQLACDEMNRAKFGQLGACELVIQLLALHTSTNVTLAGSKAIHRLACDNDTNARALRALGAVALLEEMSTQRGLDTRDVAFVKKAMASLDPSSVSSAPSSPSSSSPPSSSPPCSSPFSSSPSSPSMSVEQALAVIAKAEKNNNEASCVLVVEALRRHGTTSELVAAKGCEAVAALAFSFQSRRVLATAGAVPLVEAVASSHEGQATRDCCTKALKWLAGGKAPSMSVEQALASIAKANELASVSSCTRLVEALRVHGATNKDVALRGFQAILVLSSNGAIRIKLGQLGSCLLIYQVLFAHKDVSIVTRFGCACVESLAKDNESNKRALIEAGVVSLVDNIFKNEMLDEETSSNARSALVSLTSSNVASSQAAAATAVVRVGKVGGGYSSSMSVEQAIANIAKAQKDKDDAACESVVDALRAHGMTDQKIAFRGFGAVFLLASDEGRRTKLGRCGACEAVVDVLFAHVSNDATWRGLAATNWLANSSGTNARLLVAAGALELVTAIANYSQGLDTRVFEEANLAVSILEQQTGDGPSSSASSSSFFSTTISKALRDNNEAACAAVVDALRGHFSSQEMALCSIGAIIELAHDAANKQALIEAQAVCLLNASAKLSTNQETRRLAKTALARIKSPSA